MTIQDLTTTLGQYLGAVAGLYVSVSYFGWPLWMALLIGIPVGFVAGVLLGLLIAKLIDR